MKQNICFQFSIVYTRFLHSFQSVMSGLRRPSLQWRNEGDKGGHLPPGAALWGGQIEVGMLRTNHEM